MSLTFVVGTGRCGSTMLSNILNEHPDVLSISEFMNCVKTEEDSEDVLLTRTMDGDELWRLLGGNDPVADGMITARIPSPELIYPYDTGRFDAVGGVPRIANQVLPLISDDPDSLFDKLAADVPGWPRRAEADQWRALFGALSDMTGRRVVVERSGGSLHLAPVLGGQFPEARFLLLHRDGPDCVLSMSRHAGMRLSALRIMAALAIPGIAEGAGLKEIMAAAPPEFQGLLAPPFDGRRFMSHPVPLSIFAWMWSYGTREGVSGLRKLPSGTWTSMRYEDLVSAPRALLTKVAAFIGVPAEPRWLDWACDFVTSGRTGAAAALSPAELASLRAACASGARALTSLESRLTA